MSNTPQLGTIPTVITENLIFIARDNYRLYSLDIRNRQTTIQNIYFWIASALFTVYAAAFQPLFMGKEFLHLAILPEIPPLAHKFLVVCAFSLCAYVIFTGVDAMRGRGEGQELILGEYSPLAVYEGYLRNNELSEADICRHFLRECQKHGYANARECARNGKHLRNTSYALLFSMFLGTIAFLF